MGTFRSEPSDAQGDEFANASTLAEPRSVRPENAYTVAPGTLLTNKYRVVRTLGRGGMGIVVEAFHLELQLPVAIKLLLPELMEYTEAASRFQREARAVTKLASQHVARVLDVDTLPSGEPYIVMEFLKGEDLAQRGKRPIPLNVSDAVDYIVQACDAIAEAHSIGIVHRDLKPANLFLVRKNDGEAMIKVLDFGVSKLLSGNVGEVSITQATTILGSALYMSPEQMRSARDVDARTDIYALGACLYEMLARRPPYMAGSFPELCAAVYSGPPMPITDWSPDVPDGLAKVIDKALAHEPEARYADVPELVQALAPFATDDTRQRIEAILKRHAPHLAMPAPSRKRRTYDPVFESDAAGPSPRRSGRWAVWALLLVGLVGAGVAFHSRLPWAFLRGTTAAPDAQNAGKPSPTGTSLGASAKTDLAPSSGASATPAAASANDAPSASAPPPASAAPSASATSSVSAASSASAISSVNAASSASAALSANAAPSASSAHTAASAKPATSVKQDVSQPRPAVTAAPPSSVATAPAPPPATPAPPAAPATARPGQPVMNPGLSDQTCYAIEPDGSKKVVPCN